MFTLPAADFECLYSVHEDDEAPLQCNTEKDKGRFRHRTAGKHDNTLYIYVGGFTTICEIYHQIKQCVARYLT